MRIPPENTGSAIVVTTTIGTMAGGIAPFLSQAGFPLTMIIIDAIVLLNILLTCFLSKPGAYMPKSPFLRSVTLIRLNSGTKNSDVERPRLNKIGIDPDLCKPHDGNTPISVC